MALVPEPVLAEVRVTTDGGLWINGRVIAHQGLTVEASMDDLPVLTVRIPILTMTDFEGRINVTYIVSLQGSGVETIDAPGPTVAAALRALADKVEAQPTQDDD